MGDDTEFLAGKLCLFYGEIAAILTKQAEDGGYYTMDDLIDTGGSAPQSVLVDLMMLYPGLAPAAADRLTWIVVDRLRKRMEKG